MTRDADLPQTVGEASDAGWRWLNVDCLQCRNKGQLTLSDLTPSMRLAELARKLKCQKCQGRRVHVALRAYVGLAEGRPQATYRRISFEGDRAVPPLRD